MIAKIWVAHATDSGERDKKSSMVQYVGESDISIWLNLLSSSKMGSRCNVVFLKLIWLKIYSPIPKTHMGYLHWEKKKHEEKTKKPCFRKI